MTTTPTTLSMETKGPGGRRRGESNSDSLLATFLPASSQRWSQIAMPRAGIHITPSRKQLKGKRTLATGAMGIEELLKDRPRDSSRLPGVTESMERYKAVLKTTEDIERLLEEIGVQDLAEKTERAAYSTTGASEKQSDDLPNILTLNDKLTTISLMPGLLPQREISDSKTSRQTQRIHTFSPGDMLKGSKVTLGETLNSLTDLSQPNTTNILASITLYNTIETPTHDKEELNDIGYEFVRTTQNNINIDNNNNNTSSEYISHIYSIITEPWEKVRPVTRSEDLPPIIIKAKKGLVVDAFNMPGAISEDLEGKPLTPSYNRSLHTPHYATLESETSESKRYNKSTDNLGITRLDTGDTNKDQSNKHPSNVVLGSESLGTTLSQSPRKYSASGPRPIKHASPPTNHSLSIPPKIFSNGNKSMDLGKNSSNLLFSIPKNGASIRMWEIGGDVEDKEEEIKEKERERMSEFIKTRVSISSNTRPLSAKRNTITSRDINRPSNEQKAIRIPTMQIQKEQTTRSKFMKLRPLDKITTNDEYGGPTLHFDRSKKRPKRSESPKRSVETVHYNSKQIMDSVINDAVKYATIQSDSLSMDVVSESDNPMFGTGCFDDNNVNNESENIPVSTKDNLELSKNEVEISTISERDEHSSSPSKRSFKGRKRKSSKKNNLINGESETIIEEEKEKEKVEVEVVGEQEVELPGVSETITNIINQVNTEPKPLKKKIKLGRSTSDSSTYIKKKSRMLLYRLCNDNFNVLTNMSNEFEKIQIKRPHSAGKIKTNSLVKHHKKQKNIKSYSSDQTKVHESFVSHVIQASNAINLCDSDIQNELYNALRSTRGEKKYFGIPDGLKWRQTLESDMTIGAAFASPINDENNNENADLKLIALDVPLLSAALPLNLYTYNSNNNEIQEHDMKDYINWCIEDVKLNPNAEKRREMRQREPIDQYKCTLRGYIEMKSNNNIYSEQRSISNPVAARSSIDYAKLTPEGIYKQKVIDTIEDSTFLLSDTSVCVDITRLNELLGTLPYENKIPFTCTLLDDVKTNDYNLGLDHTRSVTTHILHNIGTIDQFNYDDSFMSDSAYPKMNIILKNATIHPHLTSYERIVNPEVQQQFIPQVNTSQVVQNQQSTTGETGATTGTGNGTMTMTRVDTKRYTAARSETMTYIETLSMDDSDDSFDDLDHIEQWYGLDPDYDFSDLDMSIFRGKKGLDKTDLLALFRCKNKVPGMLFEALIKAGYKELWQYYQEEYMRRMGKKFANTLDKNAIEAGRVSASVIFMASRLYKSSSFDEFYRLCLYNEDCRNAIRQVPIVQTELGHPPNYFIGILRKSLEIWSSRLDLKGKDSTLLSALCSRFVLVTQQKILCIELRIRYIISVIANKQCSSIILNSSKEDTTQSLPSYLQDPYIEQSKQQQQQQQQLQSYVFVFKKNTKALCESMANELVFISFCIGLDSSVLIDKFGGIISNSEPRLPFTGHRNESELVLSASYWQNNSSVESQFNGEVTVRHKLLLNLDGSGAFLVQESIHENDNNNNGGNENGNGNGDLIGNPNSNMNYVNEVGEFDFDMDSSLRNSNKYTSAGFTKVDVKKNDVLAQNRTQAIRRRLMRLDKNK